MTILPFDPSSTVPTRYWSREDDGRIRCTLCPRFCRLNEGQRGLCFVRGREGDAIVLTTYGRSSGFCIDPIEKKPLNHFLPGTATLSLGTAGCNLGCVFCQNHDMSKSRETDILAVEASPRAVARAAKALGCDSVAFTYNDPVIFHEYARDIAAECRAIGVKTVAVTAGYITDAARPDFFASIDAANIDLKAFSDGFYRNLTKSELQPVLDTLIYLRRETNVWFEITTLLIPEENDSDTEIGALCDWIMAHLGADVPLHFSAFKPDYRLTHRPQTPHATLTRARRIALKAGLRHVYIGNVADVGRQSSYCTTCGERLIEREGYRITGWTLDDNSACRTCGTPLPGVFRATPGTWGPKRQSVDMRRFKEA